MTLKQIIHNHFLVLIQDKIDVFRDRISALTEDSKSDSKSSAGDKHETALSMMHLEQEKANTKLREFIEQKNIFSKINPTTAHHIVSVGSLVLVNDMWLYISCALSKITIDNKNIFAVSPQSPLGSGIIGLKKGDNYLLNGKKYTIEEVF